MKSRAKIIRKKELPDFLDHLIRSYKVFGPVKRDGIVFFDAIESGNDISLDYQNAKTSPKAALFPQSETLFRYHRKEGGVDVDVPVQGKKGQVLFGIRPCDAKGFLLLDKVFGGDCRDPYYEQRRANTIVVSLGCAKPQPACFCTALGGGPCAEEGSDLLMVDIGDQYVVKIVGDKGAILLEGNRFDDAEDESLAQAAEVKKKSEASMEPPLKIHGLKEKLDQLFDDSIWAQLTETCLGCGICTYLCPTCHCFDICDEPMGQDGIRIRTWDSCQFPLFTQQASGFNPRPLVKERFRQRIMHKFSYLVEDQGEVGCVGCGRCVTECPVNLDIRELLNALLEVEAA